MLSPYMRKAKPSKTTVAPVLQENDARNTPSQNVSALIDVLSLGGEEYWVHSDINPQDPMPKPDDVISAPLSLNNCLVPICWFFRDLANDKEIVKEFPKHLDTYLAFGYEFGAVYGTKYIAQKFNRDCGTLEVSAWGYNTKEVGRWQLKVILDVVGTFCNYIYKLPKGDPGMDSRLCDDSFVYKLILGNNRRTRVAYGVTHDQAVDIFDMLLKYIAYSISNATRNFLSNSLQTHVDGTYQESIQSIEKLYAVINETEMLSQHCAVKIFYGIEISRADCEKAQELYDMYISLTNSLNRLGNLYYELKRVDLICHLNLELKNLVKVINSVGLSYEKLRGLFDLLRS